MKKTDISKLRPDNVTLPNHDESAEKGKSQSLRIEGETPLSILAPLLPRYGATCSLDEFQQAVNLIFHNVESEVYDEIHEHMWLSLPRQFELLTADILSVAPERELKVLDIGCGTGLSSELLLRTPLGSRIRSLYLLDTSPRMLERSQARLSGHSVDVETTTGRISDLQRVGHFDLIIACSVLHHIPDLAAFAKDVRRLQAPGGFFAHLQDPNADSARNPEQQNRCEIYKRQSQPFFSRLIPRILPHRLILAMFRRLAGKQKKTYLDRVNDELIRQQVILRPMSPKDIWSVTDIHVGRGGGISVADLARYLPDYQLISRRSYAFFSELASHLPPNLREQENALIEAGSQEGCDLAAAWRLMS